MPPVQFDGQWRAVCRVCGPSGCVDGPAHALAFADAPENPTEALEPIVAERVLGWFRYEIPVRLLRQ